MIGELYSQALAGVAAPEIEHADRQRSPLPVPSWLTAAPGDESMLSRCTGPTLDVGAGAGRLTVALTARGIPALAIDITPRAVLMARAAGALALERDVFGYLPGAGCGPVRLRTTAGPAPWFPSAWTSSAALPGGGLLGLAIATKVSRILARPAVLRRRPVAALASAATATVAVYLPHLAVAGSRVIGFLPGYLVRAATSPAGTFRSSAWWYGAAGPRRPPCWCSP